MMQKRQESSNDKNAGAAITATPALDVYIKPLPIIQTAQNERRDMRSQVAGGP
jgi:hypothetical protein